jgi:sugar phosphate isomerase/epimerase
MMQFGCHTWGFHDKPLTEALGTIARLGFRYVDLGSGQHLDVVRASEKPQKVADTVRRDLEAFNLQVSDLYLMLPRISVADDERREHEVTSFKALMPFAAALGTPGITVSPGISGQGEPDAVRGRVADVLRRFVALAGEHDLRVSIEPHLDSTASTPGAVRALIREVDGLGVTLDWAHMTAQGIKPDDVVSLLPAVRHVQVRQAAPMRMQTPFDQGVLDLRRVVTLLLSAGYDGVVTVELMQTIGWHGAAEVDTVTEALRLRDTLRDLRDQFAAH